MMKSAFLAMFLWLAQPVFSNAQDLCSCPATDPSANSNCSVAPAKLDRIGFERACMALPTDTNMIALKDILQGMDVTKSIKGTLNYMSCYRTNKQQFCHFRTTLGPLIRLAAESAKLPFAVQACLFKRESEFKRDALSGAGALGYIQFMPSVIPDLNRIIQGSPQQWNIDLEKANQEWATKNEELKHATTNYARALVIDKINKIESRIRAARARIEARKVWDSYWEGTEKVPGSVTFKQTQCPNVAFAMSVTKQVFDLFFMKKVEVTQRIDGTRTVGDMTVGETSMFLAGAYNIGFGTFAKICGDSKTLSDCKKQFSPKAETHRHITSIENCSKKDSYEPMSGWRKNDCEASKCAI